MNEIDLRLVPPWSMFLSSLMLRANLKAGFVVDKRSTRGRLTETGPDLKYHI